MKKILLRLATVVVVMLLILAAVLLVKRRQAELATRPTPSIRPVAVTIKSAHWGRLAVTRHYLGVIEPEAEARLTAQTTGYITSLTKDVGDRLEKGEIVADIDPRLAAARQKALAAELDGAREDLAIRETIRDRRRGLIGKRAVSQEALDEAELAVSLAASRLRRLKEELTAATVELSFTHLEAMFAGIVSERLVEVGDLVHIGTPVLRIEEPERGYKILLRTPQETAAHLAVAAPARLSLGEQSQATTVERIYPAIIAGKLATVEIKVPNRPFNLPSYAEVGVDLTVAEPEGWIIDADCLLETGNEAMVFVVGVKQMILSRPVAVRGRLASQVVVEGSLTTADRLAAGPESLLLTLGDGVEIMPAAEAVSRTIPATTAGDNS
ncbi:MAG TPA: efflux RND transporter periplasmic adaptor subunit [Proteobacteria bacterium]|nr:efflux RND transporter periplasmic adaptor subunit [Pseudomonadota bacterium]